MQASHDKVQKYPMEQYPGSHASHPLQDAHVSYSAVSIRALVANAAAAFAPSWPLTTFIACNPLQGFEKLPFHEAVSTASALFDGTGYPSPAQGRAALQKGNIDSAALERVFTRYAAHCKRRLPMGERIINTEPLLRALLIGKAEHSVSDHLVRETAARLADEARSYWQPNAETNQTIRLLSLQFDRARQASLTPAINRHLIKWCAAFLDEGQAFWSMPHREKGLYRAWRELAAYDNTLPLGADRFCQRWFAELPAKPEEAIGYALSSLGIAQVHWEEYLRLSLAQLPGWAGLIKWRNSQPEYPWQQLAPVSLTDLLAVRLVTECLLLIRHLNLQSKKANAPINLAALLAAEANEAENTSLARRLVPALEGLLQQTPLTPQELASLTATEILPWLEIFETFVQDQGLLWLEAWEQSYRRPLLNQLTTAANQKASAQQNSRPNVQLVFCIDVRSEPLRRQLENLGHYETFGFAGFFALPMRFRPFASEKTSASCPVLLKPKYDITEQPVAEQQHRAKRYVQGKHLLHQVKTAYQALKNNLASPFALVEAVGALAGIMMLGRTVAPGMTLSLGAALQRRLLPEVLTTPTLATPAEQKDSRDQAENPVPKEILGIPKEAQVLYAEAALRIMGLTERFARLIVLCGHGSTTQNNPYASALDCGACGGHHGGPNAQAMAAILNDAEVRQCLAERGITVPADTVFIGAEHDTTTDDVKLFSALINTPPHKTLLAELTIALQKAREANSAVRTRHFGDLGQRVPTEMFSRLTALRSRDWAQVRPEWGLARNAAFIVAPRWLTKNLDLDGRCFLHSYDWQQDAHGTALETILTAPLVVAQWINSQYYFSSIDNVAYGSGSKITHNVTGKIGVMQGNGSDLMHGLPLQSVMAADGVQFHEPLRLLAVVYAPRHSIAPIVARHDILKQLFFNGWVQLVALDPEDGCAYRLITDGTWQHVETESG